MVLDWAFEQEGVGGSGGGGTTQYARATNYKSFKGTNQTVVEGMHASVYNVYPVSRTTECSNGKGAEEGNFQHLTRKVYIPFRHKAD